MLGWSGSCVYGSSLSSVRLSRSQQTSGLHEINSPSAPALIHIHAQRRVDRVSGSDTVKVDTEEPPSAELRNKPLYYPPAAHHKLDPALFGSGYSHRDRFGLKLESHYGSSLVMTVGLVENFSYLNILTV